jgi:hypothetical protein
MRLRMKLFWGGFRSGARFGAFTGMVICIVLYVVGVVLFLCIPKLREDILIDFSDIMSRSGTLLGRYPHLEKSVVAPY